jgi:hypothetical protein
MISRVRARDGPPAYFKINSVNPQESKAMGEQLIVIGRRPNLTAPLEKLSWDAINKVFQSAYYANREELVTACKRHCHAITAEGFVDYCLENDWLREVTLETQKVVRS